MCVRACEPGSVDGLCKCVCICLSVRVIMRAKGVPSSCLPLGNARDSPGESGEHILNAGMFCRMPEGHKVTPILSYPRVFISSYVYLSGTVLCSADIT